MCDIYINKYLKKNYIYIYLANLIKRNLRVLIFAIPQLFSAIFSLLTLRMYSEILLPKELGVLMLILGAITLLDAFFSSPSSQVAYYYLAKVDIFNFAVNLIKNRAKHICIITFIVQSISLVVLYFSTENKYICFIFIFIYIVYEFIRAALYSVINTSQNVGLISTQICFDALFQALLPVIFVFVTQSPFFVVVGHALSRTVSVLIELAMVMRIRSVKTSFLFKTQYIYTAYKRYMPFVGMGVIGWASSYFDRYTIAAFGGIKTVGPYAIANGIVARPYGIVTNALTTYFKPKLFKYSINKDLDNGEQTRNGWTKSALTIGVLGVVLFILLNGVLSELLVASVYKSSVETLIILFSIVMTLTISSHSYDNFILSNGNGKQLLLAQFASFPVTILFLGLGAYLYGAVGAVVGRAISECIRLLVVLFLAKKIKENIL